MRSLVVLCAVIAVLEGHALKKRSFGQVVYTVPAAVSHQSRVDIHSSPGLVAAAPVLADAVITEPLVEARAVIAPTIYEGSSAVSHQSRFDVHSYPAVLAEAPAVVAEPVLEARSVYAPAVTVYGGSAVSHQSRVDVHSSPAVVTEQLAAPAVVDARSVWPSIYASSW